MRFEDYKDSFQYARLEREDGVLEVTLHRDGGSPKWNFGPTGIHWELGAVFRTIAADLDNRVVILTAAGEEFMTEVDYGDPADAPDESPAEFWDRQYREGRALLMNLLDIEVPVIAAINGDAFIHAEIPVLSDIVLAAEGVRIADKAHFPGGAVPGDGVHVVWPMLLGPNRGRYFLLTGEEIEADEGRRLGFIGEVLPADRLMPRARELARRIAEKPPMMARYTRIALTHHLKEKMLAGLGYGMMLEGVAVLSKRI